MAIFVAPMISKIPFPVFLSELCVLCGEMFSSNFEFSGRKEGCQWREKLEKYFTTEGTEIIEEHKSKKVGNLNTDFPGRLNKII